MTNYIADQTDLAIAERLVPSDNSRGEQQPPNPDPFPEESKH